MHYVYLLISYIHIVDVTLSTHRDNKPLLIIIIVILDGALKHNLIHIMCIHFTSFFYNFQRSYLIIKYMICTHARLTDGLIFQGSSLVHGHVCPIIGKFRIKKLYYIAYNHDYNKVLYTWS